MVRYRKSPVNPRIEDRRGSRTGGRRIAIGGGGIGLGGLLLVLALNVCVGGGLGDLGGLAGELVPVNPVPPQTPLTTIAPGNDPDAELKEYMSAVYTDNDLLWEDVFAQAGRSEYRSPGLVLFTDFTDSGCGGADERVGPHYCPLDEKIYLDFSFFTQLRDRFGARGDLAPAYVVSHEFAHHVQTVLGISEQVRTQQTQNPSQSNELSIAMELQADCFAGVWLSTVAVDSSTETVEDGFIEIDPGEVTEAVEAAAAVGDDKIQRAATGMVNPEQWTHGSAQQRSDWLLRGLRTGDPGECDTFSEL